jgi:hypothetical protein
MKRTKTFFFLIVLFIADSITVYAGGKLDDISNNVKKANEAVRSVNNVIRDVDETVEGVGGIKGGVKDIGQDTADVLGVDTTPQPQQTQPAPIQAQTQTPSGAVPLPPLPNVTLTMPPMDGGYKVNVTPAQLRQMFENRDQRKYTEYLFNSGYIPEAEFKSRSENLDQVYYGILGPIGNADQIAMIYANGAVEEEIKKLWPYWSPGWPGKEIRQTSGLNLQQPQGTRSSFSFDIQMIRGGFTPYSEQIFNNIKQQLEAGLGAAMTYEADFDRYTYVLRSNKSASGRPYWIILYRSTSTNRIYLEVSQLNRDP